MIATIARLLPWSIIDSIDWQWYGYSGSTPFLMIGMSFTCKPSKMPQALPNITSRSTLRGILFEEYSPRLSEENLQLVSKTWDICAFAANSTAWIFVYPRECSLVQKYLQRLRTSVVQIHIWLGPQAHLSSMKALLKNSV